jgi:NAD(P)-dependent dehydrogenase (short-subunit alcohol dehydrogenase family)
MASNWSTKELGDLSGRQVIVTGANSGIGFYTALELGRAGASVVVACRDPKRGEAALAELKQSAPKATFRLEALDLADLSSVRAFAARYLATNEPLDILINNAGLMMPPQRQTTSDGFELQFGTNHLGHFALTGLLLPALKKGQNPRVVSVSSAAAIIGKLNLEDLQSEKRYKPMSAYSQSKLANLAFMKELGKRAPWLISVGAHPGGTKTNLQKDAFQWSVKIFGQETSMGALPTLRAATEQAPSSTYYAPKDWFNTRGAPIQISLPESAKDSSQHAALWEASERLTGVRFEGL